MIGIEVYTFETDFLRLALMLGTLSAINIFYMLLRIFGYEITYGGELHE